MYRRLPPPRPQQASVPHDEEYRQQDGRQLLPSGSQLSGQDSPHHPHQGVPHDWQQGQLFTYLLKHLIFPCATPCDNLMKMLISLYQ